MSLISKFLDLLYPPKCVFCGRITESGNLCGKCELPYFTKGAVSSGEFFKEYTAVFCYKGLVRDSLLRYKFKNCPMYAKTYAPLLKESIEKDLGKFDVISWVPISKKRYRKRGYDQTELLASETAKLFGKTAERTLVKIKHNPPQSSVSGKEKRRANVLGVYEIFDKNTVKGKTVLLIDDIITTGATLSECARTLLMAGAEEVICAAMANAD